MSEKVMKDLDKRISELLEQRNEGCISNLGKDRLISALLTQNAALKEREEQTVAHLSVALQYCERNGACAGGSLGTPDWFVSAAAITCELDRNGCYTPEELAEIDLGPLEIEVSTDSEMTVELRNE
ncbi:hypothetical protein [Neptuniibacter sp. QD37_11]|uniref:hypothetical protein n=1 Tax=Neptuniibacter sp. QD37_11 TaxID=3398209 RepID=UPI0039F63461